MPRSQKFLVDIGDGLSIMLGMPTIATWKNNTRPKKTKAGTFGFNTQTNNLEYWDGQNWYAGAMDKA